MKKLFYIEKILLLVVLLLIQSCSVLKDKYEFGHDAISFLYVNNTNSNEYKRITLSPTGILPTMKIVIYYSANYVTIIKADGIKKKTPSS